MNLEEANSNEMGKEFNHIGKYLSTSLRKMSKILDKDYSADYGICGDYEDYI